MMRFIPLIIVGIAAVVFAVLLSQPKLMPVAKTGQHIANLQLPTLSGEQQSLLPGKKIIVNVFASWCVPCGAEMTQLAELQQASLPIIGLAYKDKTVELNGFLTRFGNPYTTILRDNDGLAATALAITGVPETFVIDADGRVAWHFAGALDAAQIAEIRQAMQP